MQKHLTCAFWEHSISYTDCKITCYFWVRVRTVCLSVGKKTCKVECFYGNSILSSSVPFWAAQRPPLDDWCLFLLENDHHSGISRLLPKNVLSLFFRMLFDTGLELKNPDFIKFQSVFARWFIMYTASSVTERRGKKTALFTQYFGSQIIPVFITPVQPSFANDKCTNCP